MQVTNNYGQVMCCKYLGKITAYSTLGNYGFKKKAYDSAMNELRNKAAQMGANILAIQKVSNVSSGTEIIGDSYLCGGH